MKNPDFSPQRTLPLAGMWRFSALPGDRDSDSLRRFAIVVGALEAAGYEDGIAELKARLNGEPANTMPETALDNEESGFVPRVEQLYYGFRAAMAEREIA